MHGFDKNEYGKALCDAALFGSGYLRLLNDGVGRVTLERLDPKQVMRALPPPDEGTHPATPREGGMEDKG